MNSRRQLRVRVAQRNAAAWHHFFIKSFAGRNTDEIFETTAQELIRRHPLPPANISDLLLRPQSDNRYCIVPRVPMYLQTLFNLEIIDFPSILRSLYKYSTLHTQSKLDNSSDVGLLSKDKSTPGQIGPSANPKSTPKPARWQNSYSYDEAILYGLTKAVALGKALRDAQDALHVVQIVSDWMTLFSATSAAFNADELAGVLDLVAKEEMEAARAAFVAVLLNVCENNVMMKTLSMPMAKEARAVLSSSLASFIPTLHNNASQQMSERLEMFRTQTLAGFEPSRKKIDKVDIVGNILDSTVWLESYVIPPVPLHNSRAGLYIYLNASLVGRPLIDDDALFTYLHNRYQGNAQTTFISLILASFDVLANAVFRNEGRNMAHLFRSFLINKLPLLLAQLSPSLYPSTPEYCIAEALRGVDTNAFPTLSSMFDETRNNNPFTDSVREDFCFACCLHGLIPQSNIETMLGENTYQTLPTGGRYTKESLVQECLTDPGKAQSLIGELDNMDGNVGAVCQALTELLGRLCQNRETMSLKVLCNQLVRKPLSLDALLLFEKPVAILQPLCDLLDNWKYEEDQGEYQPVYEEFGSVLLLVLAFSYRYNLTAYDMGVKSPDSFVRKLLSNGHVSPPSGELSERENGHINGWILGLFDTESGGLGDDLMSSCPPQEFYLLIPSLFHQIVLGFSAGYLTEETMKSGVEYLVDTFLLPCLVTAIRFLADYLWVDNKAEQKAIIKILQLILLPNAISTEASTMLSSVMNTIAKPLEHALRTYQRRDPKSQDIEPLLRALAPSIPLSRRTGNADHNELESWTANPAGGISVTIKHTLQAFVQWSLNPVVNVMPTAYTHRQILAALKLVGAKRLLAVILEEIRIRAHSDQESESIMYDIATALICAPDVTNDAQPSPAPIERSPSQTQGQLEKQQPVRSRKRLSLRDVLRFAAEGAQKLLRKDIALAEITVRLYRRVEAQLQLPLLQPTANGAALLMNATSGPEGMANVIAAAAAAVVVQEDNNVMAVDGVGIDLSMANVPTSKAGSAGGAGLADTDIFGNLPGGTDLLDGWDNMGNMEIDNMGI